MLIQEAKETSNLSRYSPVPVVHLNAQGYIFTYVMKFPWGVRSGQLAQNNGWNQWAEERGGAECARPDAVLPPWRCHQNVEKPWYQILHTLLAGSTVT